MVCYQRDTESQLSSTASSSVTEVDASVSASAPLHQYCLENYLTQYELTVNLIKVQAGTSQTLTQK